MAQATNTEQPGAGAPDSGVVGSVEDRLAEKLFGPSEDTAPEANAQVEGDEGEPAAAADAGEEDGAPQAPVLEDVEFNGKSYKLAPELKSALMAQADYTRGKQETASLRRMLDLERVQLQHRTQFEQMAKPELDTLTQLQYQLNAYRALDWMSMDTDTASKTRIMVDQLKDQEQHLSRALTQKHSQFESEMGQLMQSALARGDEYLKHAIKDWSPKIQASIETYGQTEGYSEVEMKMLTDARMKKTLWKAMQWDALKSQQASGRGRVLPAAPGIRPGAASSNQSAQQIRDLNYHKSIKNAKSDSEKAKLVQNRLADKMFGPAPR